MNGNDNVGDAGDAGGGDDGHGFADRLGGADNANDGALGIEYGPSTLCCVSSVRRGLGFCTHNLPDYRDFSYRHYL